MVRESRGNTTQRVALARRCHDNALRRVAGLFVSDGTASPSMGMRILWVSDSPTTPSGFGGVTAAVTSRLAERGHRVEIVGWQTRGTSERWHGIPVHPVRHDQFGSDVVLAYLMRLQPHVLVTLGDVW